MNLSFYDGCRSYEWSSQLLLGLLLLQAQTQLSPGLALDLGQQNNHYQGQAIRTYYGLLLDD